MMMAIFVVFRTRSKQIQGTRDPEYRTFFIMGVAFLPIGIATGNAGFLAMGLIFIIMGITNREKWSNDRKIEG